jgi:ribosome-binding factor A
MNIRIERLENLFVKEISYILNDEVRDEDIKFVTVTDCTITADLSFAKVYVTVFDESKKESTLKALKNASGFVRTSLANKVDIRYMPEIIFVYDESSAYASKIENIIKKEKEGQALEENNGNTEK